MGELPSKVVKEKNFDSLARKKRKKNSLFYQREGPFTDEEKIFLLVEENPDFGGEKSLRHLKENTLLMGRKKEFLTDIGGCRGEVSDR